MAQTNHRKIEDDLLDAQTAITNAINDGMVASALSNYGFDGEIMAEGKALYEEAYSLHKKQVAEYGEKYEATRKLHEALEKAASIYSKTFRIARQALKNNEDARNTLYLSNGRKKSISGQIEQAQVFYSNLISHPEMVQAMNRFAYDRERLETEKAIADDAAKAYAQRDLEKSQAQHATRQRDKKLDELGDWMDEFMVVAEVALEDEPQLLEMLGEVKS